MNGSKYDLTSFTGKQIDVESYYYSLIKRGWKYDTDESNLFTSLSKTFWDENVKVLLALEDYCCVPPNGEKTKIEYIDFFKFDPTVFKEKSIYTEYEGLYQPDEYRDFETVEDYIKWMNENDIHYIAHADFNTSDFSLMTLAEIKEIPIEIQNVVWEDLHNIEQLTVKKFSL